jgi:hypothetical protein
MRVFDAVKNQQQQRLALVASQLVFDQGAQSCLIEDRLSFDLDDHPLVTRLAADLQQACPVRRLNFDALCFRLLDDRFDPRIRGLIFRKHLDDLRSRTRQELFDRAQARNVFLFAHRFRFLPLPATAS